MKKENKALLVKYIICFAVASLITVAVFWSKGFFGHSVAVNIQILADGFFVSGILMTLFAGMMFISGEGALIGIGFILRSVVLTFIPMGRQKHEKYADYRERKLRGMKKTKDHSILVIGLLFLIVGIIFNIIWYVKFYNAV
ncbi:MAG: DUF3899 domain-containing protein [Eubacteriales bacterium]